MQADCVSPPARAMISPMYNFSEGASHIKESQSKALHDAKPP